MSEDVIDTLAGIAAAMKPPASCVARLRLRERRRDERRDP